MFGTVFLISFFSDQCMELFGSNYTLTETYKLVGAVQKKYGGTAAYKGNKVVFPNGSIDPWKSLGLPVGDPDKNIDAFIIDGVAHCADMYPASPNDKQSLTDARARILNSLNTWIEDALKPTGMFPMKLFCKCQHREMLRSSVISGSVSRLGLLTTAIFVLISWCL
ncbi:hypothetical protein COOONC_24427 [Cooperia oncophora]